MSLRLGKRGRLVLAALALGVLVVGIASALALRDPGNVSNPDVEFDASAPSAPPTSNPREPRPDQDPFDDGFEWPIYGFTKARTKFLPLAEPLRPPFVETWSVTGRILLEFPPVLCGGQLFLLKNNAALYGISRRTGRVRWKRKTGYLAASSPACSDGVVYVTVLNRDKGINAGSVMAVNAADGKTIWSRRLPSRSESSPLLDRGRLYFGSEDGTVYSMRASDGETRWRTKVGGAVKGALALADGTLYFGDYNGQVTALRQADGSQVWQTGTSGSSLGRSGNFYATPAVAFGRVYIGNTDGFVYSFSSRTGELAWRSKTGDFVYSSPAVSDVRGGMVYAGSYDGKLYAFNARNGDVRWTRDSGGRISGGPQVIGDLVFYSNLARKSTGAVGAANGQPIWSTGRGAFNPAISDGRRIYLVGYSSLFALTTPAQARRDRAAVRAGMSDEQRAATDRAARRRVVNRRLARERRVQQRALVRRVAERRALVSRINRMRRRGIRVCFEVGPTSSAQRVRPGGERREGRKVCRLPRPLVCFRSEPDGRTVCRPRER